GWRTSSRSTPTPPRAGPQVPAPSSESRSTVLLGCRGKLRLLRRGSAKPPSPRDSACPGDDGAGPGRHELEQLVDVLAQLLDHVGLLQVGGALDVFPVLTTVAGERAITIDQAAVSERAERAGDLVRRVAHLVGGGRSRVRCRAPAFRQQLDFDLLQP